MTIETDTDLEGLRRIGRVVALARDAMAKASVNDEVAHGIPSERVLAEGDVVNIDVSAFWEGLVMTIEPFLTTGARTVYEADDGWTLETPDGSWGAQFEHTLVITRGQPIVLTT